MPKSNIRRKKLTYQSKVVGKRKRQYSVFCQTNSDKFNCIKQNNLSSQNLENYSNNQSVSTNICSTEASPSYAEKRAKLSASWRSLEERLLVVSQTLYLKQVDKCCFCGDHQENIIRCCDCGPQIFFCLQCWKEQHEHTWFHIPHIWNGFMFEEMECHIPTLKRYDGHDCTTSYVQDLDVIDYKGFSHKVKVMFCKCESKPETLLRLNLWPCSPVIVHTAISIHLLELIRVLCLEKHVSTEGILNALDCRFSAVPLRHVKKSRLSETLLREVLEAYRHHVYRLQHMSNMVGNETIDDGTLCPACEGNDGDERTYCFDANFGLVRRRASGEESYESHHANRIFCHQPDVDAFVESHIDGASSTSCNNFQAGNAVRSKIKNSKLDVTGVFGVCCKHEFPKLFMDMTQGERFGYGVWALMKLKEENKSLKIFYDIACKFQSHLKVQIPGILDQTQLAVPVFHGYGHTAACQSNFSPRTKKGFGLTEGEAMERLWSYLRNFNRITKEMKPEHRKDLLSDGLIHQASKLKKKLGSMLVNRYNRANSTLEQSESELQTLLYSCSENVTPQEVARRLRTKQHEPVQNPLLPDEDYVLTLHKFNNLKKQQECGEEGNLSEDNAAIDLAMQVARYDIILKKHEKRRKAGRLHADDIVYSVTLASAAEKQRSELREKMQSLAAERKFLVTLIQKYPAGQAIVQKLMNSIKRVMISLKKLIMRYNEMKACPVISCPSSLTVANVLEGFGESQQHNTADLKILRCHQMMQRSKEEIEFIEKDVVSVNNFFCLQIKQMESMVQSAAAKFRPYIMTQQLKTEILLLNFREELKDLNIFETNELLSTPIVGKLLSECSREREEDIINEPDIDEEEVASLIANVSYGSDSEDDLGDSNGL